MSKDKPTAAPSDRFTAMSEAELRGHMHQTFNEMGFDDGLGALMHKGIDKMPQEKLLEIARNLNKYEREMPAILEEVDALIAKMQATPKPELAKTLKPV